MRRITKAALGSIAGCTLVLGATQVASGEAGVGTYTFAGPLTDLNTSKYSVFDSGKAILKIAETAEGTTYSLRVKGIDSTAFGTEYHSHLHVGPCIEDDPLAAGGHYNDTGGAATDLTEVWFELAPSEDGVALSETSVSFVPSDFHGDQVMSVVIHGLDGGREACLPLDFSEDQQ